METTLLILLMHISFLTWAASCFVSPRHFSSRWACERVGVQRTADAVHHPDGGGGARCSVVEADKHNHCEFQWGFDDMMTRVNRKRNSLCRDSNRPLDLHYIEKQGFLVTYHMNSICEDKRPLQARLVRHHDHCAPLHHAASLPSLSDALLT